MDENNQKISKTKGNGLTMEEWLRYGAPREPRLLHVHLAEVGQAALFRRHPQGDRRVPAAPGRLQPGAAEGANAANPLDNPVWSVHARRSAGQGLAGVVLAAAEPGLGGQRLGQGDPLGVPRRATCRARRPQSEPLLDRLADYAINYYEDFVLPAKTLPRARRDAERAAFADLAARLKALPADCQDAEAIQNEVYEAGKAGRLRAAARLVPGALRSAARPEPGPAVRLLRRDLRAGRDHRADREGAGQLPARDAAEARQRHFPATGEGHAPPPGGEGREATTPAPSRPSSPAHRCRSAGDRRNGRVRPGCPGRGSRSRGRRRARRSGRSA